MKILWLMAAGVLAAAPSIRLQPEVITACQGGVGQATVIWDSDGKAPVTLYAGDSAMSGPEAATGSSPTGLWVAEGMIFSLRNAAGETLASVKAVLRCDAGGWWPLAVGNEWHFRVNDRAGTGGHTVWRVARKERINDHDWFVLDPGPESPTRLRADDDGRLYRLAADGREVLLLDAGGIQAGAWTVTGKSPVAVTLAGTFGEELSWRGPVAGLSQENGRLARGVGPTYYQTNVIAGSSGGFGSGLTLLEAVVGGARFVPNYRRLELSLESQTVDLSAKSARNCAIPCYFTACFGADLAAAYKPCMEASLRGGGPGAKLALLDPGGKAVFEAVADGWVRIPLCTGNDLILPPGRYSVTATFNGTAVAMPLDIR